MKAGITAIALLTAVTAAWTHKDPQPTVSMAPVAPAPSQNAAWVLEVAAEGNEARYRIREQLVGFDLPNDAIGKTSKVTGRISLDSKGNVIANESVIEVQAADITSDKDRRDNYVRTRTLLTEKYPTVTLKPTALRGLRFPLPTAGSQKFEIVGDLTVMEVTKPTTWQVTATFGKDQVTGAAVTRFTFDDFKMTQPKVRSVLSVADTIGLEYDFKLSLKPAAKR